MVVRGGGLFEVALAAAAGAGLPLQEIGGPIVGELANSSCSGCLDILRHDLAPLLSAPLLISVA